MNLKDILLLPNIVTISRIISIPFIIYLFSTNKFHFAIGVLVFALLSDFFDGFLARKLNQSSLLGSILDPVADKLILLSLFGFLISLSISPLIYFIPLASRNISQLLSIPILLFNKIQFKVKPKLLPKIATTMSFILLFFYLASLAVSREPAFERFFWLFDVESPLNFVVIPMILISIVLEIYIFITFLIRFVKIYKGTEDTFE